VTVAPKKALGQHFLVDRNILGVVGRLAEPPVAVIPADGFEVRIHRPRPRPEP